MYDYAVIGKGLIGSAAARYLSQSGSTLMIGPDEPANLENHRGIFASHYDQGRITREIASDKVWAELAKRSLDRYGELERSSQISFHKPVGCVYIADQEGIAPYKQVAQERSVNHQFFDNAKDLQGQFPFFGSFDTFSALSESAPAGYINPRDLIKAQLHGAKSQGAEIIAETVLDLEVLKSKIKIHTGNDTTFEAKRVLLATGAYANAFNLLEKKLELRVKSETVCYAKVSEDEAKRLQAMPSLILDTAISYLNDFYLLPPILYPDGHYYVKLGANTAADSTLTTSRDMADWMRKGKSNMFIDNFKDVLKQLIPDLSAESFHTGRCLVSYTKHGKPYIDTVLPKQLYVATGGNGASAKSSDAIGHLAANLVEKNTWQDSLEPTLFALPS